MRIFREEILAPLKGDHFLGVRSWDGVRVLEEGSVTTIVCSLEI